MSYQEVSAQIELLGWRDHQLSSISEQLNENFPQLRKHLLKQVITEHLVKKVNDASESDFEALAYQLNSKTQKAVQDWSIKQCKTAIKQANKQLKEALNKFPKDFVFSQNIWKQFSIALPQSLNIGPIGDDLTETIIVPSFAYEINLTAYQINKRSIVLYPWPESQLRHIRERLKEDLLEAVHLIVFGDDGLGKKKKKKKEKKPNDVDEIICVKNKIQAIIIQNGQKEIQERVVPCP